MLIKKLPEGDRVKVLVLATDYPRPDGYISCFFIHSRNKQYIQKGIDVSVVSFKAARDYIIDGVKVYTLGTYENMLKECNYDTILSHAPNLRNHYRFFKKYGKYFDNIIFFFHGHEVLITSEIYPRPYDYNKMKFAIVDTIRKVYDKFKLIVWRKYFNKIAYKSQFVFVSNWMYEMFTKFVEIDPKSIKNRSYIIYNCIGEQFENISYNVKTEKKYDFITIRNNLDGSKYGIDIVTRIAENNPNYKFCVVGQGKYFKYNRKPNNLEWIDKNLTHEEVVDFLNKSKCALLPTRADAQGVMACEMATFGIPLITSDIDVCREIFEGFENVAFIDNDDSDIHIEPIFEELTSINVKKKNTKYFAENTIGKEIELFNKQRGK